jgi:hypothetical protein
VKVTEKFETASGHKVTVTGKLVELTKSVKYEIDVNVEGFGSQGGTPTRTTFSKNGIDYVAIVGQLPLTKDQLDIIDGIRAKLMIAKEQHPLMADKEMYGTYEEVEIKHPWMKGTY